MALETPESIEALADQLTSFADDLHDGLMRAIKAQRLDQPTALTISQQENALRQKANAMFADAARCAVSGLEVEQAELFGVVEAAKAQLRGINDIRKATRLISGVISLGASVATQNAGPIQAALKDIRNELN